MIFIKVSNLITHFILCTYVIGLIFIHKPYKQHDIAHIASNLNKQACTMASYILLSKGAHIVPGKIVTNPL